MPCCHSILWSCYLCSSTRKTGKSSTFPPSCDTWDKHLHARCLTAQMKHFPAESLHICHRFHPKVQQRFSAVLTSLFPALLNQLKKTNKTKYTLFHMRRKNVCWSCWTNEQLIKKGENAYENTLGPCLVSHRTIEIVFSLYQMSCWTTLGSWGVPPLPLKYQCNPERNAPAAELPVQISRVQNHNF